MSKTKLNNILSFKDHISLDKLQNKPGKIVEGNNIQSFDAYNENWDDIKRIGRKIGTTVGAIKMTDDEWISKGKKIENSKKMPKIIDAIKNHYSEQYKNTFDTLSKNKNVVYYKYLIFLNDFYVKIKEQTPFYVAFDPETGKTTETGRSGMHW